MNTLRWRELLEPALFNAARQRPDVESAERKLFLLVQDGLSDPLLRAGDHEADCILLKRSMVEDVEVIVRTYIDFDSTIVDQLDIWSAKGVCAVLARLLNPARPNNFLDLVLEEIILLAK